MTKVLQKNIFIFSFVFAGVLSGCQLNLEVLSNLTSKPPETPPTVPVETPPVETPPSINTRKIKNLGIFYGWPSAVDKVHEIDWNNRVSLASVEIAKYDRFILGAGLEDPGHGDHANTLTIISNVKAGTSGTQIYGYVCIGTCGGSYPSAAIINDNLNQWDARGGRNSV